MKKTISHSGAKALATRTRATKANDFLEVIDKIEHLVNPLAEQVKTPVTGNTVLYVPE